MAELASGAVSSLLGVIQNEARLLGRVQGDMQFIREEMESMNSFLQHLARTVPPGGRHDEQVLTWMNQVRLLAQDCNNFIDLYLYRENPDLHLPRDGPWRYLFYFPWLVRKYFTQRSAAVKLAKLKDRARDVGERRVRYGVDIPEKAGRRKSAASGAELAEAADDAPAAATGEEDEDGDDGWEATAAMADHRTTLAGPGGVQDLEDYFLGRLDGWIKQQKQEQEQLQQQEQPSEAAEEIPTITIVAPSNQDGALALAKGAAHRVPEGFRSVMVDIPNVHRSSHPPRAEDILCYIWRGLELAHYQQQGTCQGEAEQERRWWRASERRYVIQSDKMKAIYHIEQDTQDKLDKKIEEIKNKVGNVKGDDELKKLNLLETEERVKNNISEKPLAVLLCLLIMSADAAAEQDQQTKEKWSTLAEWHDDIIKAISKKLRDNIYNEVQQGDYEGILREVFLPAPKQARKSTVATSTTTQLGEEQIKAMIHEAKGEILQELIKKILEDKSDKKQVTDEPAGCQGQNPQPHTAEIKVEIEKIQDQIMVAMEKLKQVIKRELQDRLKIKGIVDKVRYYLKQDKALVIFRLNAETGWDEIRYALTQLGCIAGAVIVTTSKEYYHPQGASTMEYSLVGLYHDIVLQTTRKQIDEEDRKHIDPHIFGKILNTCPNELCMKIFAQTLHANPKRSNEDLRKLHKTLHAMKAASKPFATTTKKMLKFAYNDLPKEYKACLLYLAIFPRGYKIRRSTLIGRWVAEGLITTEDWSWNNSVDEAEQCFEELINRSLVCPDDIGAIGKVKTCTVTDLVHEFITKIAKKQHIVEARLSHHLARHFSISNDLHLRGSDSVKSFFKRISDSSRLSVLKVLDLEDCRCFGEKSKHNLKQICSKIMLLKYLSLRGTDITELPHQINDLHELEVLDIRQTMVKANATRHLQLLKLKRLLAGHTDSSASAVLIPEKIENMLSMEVLSNVKPRSDQDLKDIGKLCQLRKLGVVIEKGKHLHLSKLARAISDLHECLQSLSIILPPTEHIQYDNISSYLKYDLDVLESLNLSGISQKEKLLPLVIEKCKKLTKVTLTSTWLSQDDLKDLAEVPTLEYLKLGHNAYRDHELTFNKDNFKTLKYFLVEGTNMNHIIFTGEATPELQKMFLPCIGDLKLSGVEKLEKLEELELSKKQTITSSSDNTNTTSSTSSNITCSRNNSSTSNTSTMTTSISNNNTLLSTFHNAKKLAKVTLRGTLLKEGDLQIIAKNSSICCLKLLEDSYAENELTFNKAEFPKLNLLIVSCRNITTIKFTGGSAPKISKIVWSYTNMEVHLSGLDNLPRLRELEFNGDLMPRQVKEAIKKHKNRPYFLHNKPEKWDQEKGPEENKGTRLTCCWKKQV